MVHYCGPNITPKPMRLWTNSLVQLCGVLTAPRPDLGFDPEEAFQENYAEACKLLQQILAVPPMGEEFTAAVSGLHSLANILDRLFQSWDGDTGQKFSQIKEDSEAFIKSFGDSDSGLRKLLAHAGFQRQVPDSSKAMWYFDRQDPEIRLRGLTVRLCLQRFSELQRWAEIERLWKNPTIPDQNWKGLTTWGSTS